jgi:hypothetical protein
MSGQIVYNRLIDAGKTSFDASNMSSGVYFYEVFQENKYIQSGKFLIVK